MFEGMERFLKCVELIGKGCVEAKEHQHATENQFARVDEAIRKNVLKVDFESQMNALKEELSNMLNTEINGCQA